MSHLVADCPRCGSKWMTFDVKAEARVSRWGDHLRMYEVFCVCRHCEKSATFLAQQIQGTGDGIFNEGLHKKSASINSLVTVKGFLSLKDNSKVPPPQHMPTDIESAFNEGATCLSVGCINAAATMFRLCLDHATKALLPDQNIEGLDNNKRWKLGLRLKWLFETNRLPEGLKDLSTSIKEEGNDGAHAGTLTRARQKTFSILQWRCWNASILSPNAYD